MLSREEEKKERLQKKKGKFFEEDDLPTHMVQRWRLQLLMGYDFTIVHRSARMMADANLLSRYNEMAQKYRRAGSHEGAAESVKR